MEKYQTILQIKHESECKQKSLADKLKVNQ